MADDKKPASRTMRSDPPTHPAEVLRASPKGCMESIRNRKGVNDNIAFEMEAPGTLHPSSESALEFAPEVQGNPLAKSSNVTAKVEAFTETVTTMNMMGESFPVEVQGFRMSTEPNESPSPEIQDGAVAFHALGPLSTQPLARASQRKVFKAHPRSAIVDDFQTIQSMIEDQEITGRRDLSSLMTVIREPLKRPGNERYQASMTIRQIRDVTLARLRRFHALPVTPLTKDVVKRELEQAMDEMIELGLIEAT